MKDIRTYILESFKLGKNKVIKPTEYKYFPNNKNELKEILEERLKEYPNADLNDIDTSNVKDMSLLFFNFNPHNIDISDWDVSNVINMNYMFLNCKNFNCDLSDWDVSSVETMEAMFDGCVSFEGKGLENWDIANVRNMEWIFSKCNSLKKLPSWYKKF